MSGGSSGSSGIGNIFSKYIIPGLETVGGAVSEYFAPGNPAGTALIGQGIGGFTGGGSSSGGAASPLTNVDQAAQGNYGSGSSSGGLASALPTLGTSGGGSALANALSAGAGALPNLLSASKLSPPNLQTGGGAKAGTAQFVPITGQAITPPGSFNPGSTQLSPAMLSLIARLTGGQA